MRGDTDTIMTSKTKNPYRNFLYPREVLNDPPDCLSLGEPIADVITAEEFCEGSGAKPGGTNKLAICIPTKDKHGKIIPDANKWVDNAVKFFTDLANGATEIPGTGSWSNPETHEVVREGITQVSSMVTNDLVRRNYPALEEFCCRMGLDTNQGSVAVEFNNSINYYDESNRQWKRLRAQNAPQR